MLLGVLALGLGGIAVIVWLSTRVDWRGEHVQAKVQHEDDPANGVRCYWLYTGEGGGIAMSCVPLAADAGPR